MTELSGEGQETELSEEMNETNLETKETKDQISPSHLETTTHLTKSQRRRRGRR